MTRALCVLLVMSACASEREGEGTDVLPKRGDRTTDPTILSASARCEPGNHVEDWFSVVITASDPGGENNLDMCSAKIAGATKEAQVAAGVCLALVERPCTAGQPAVIDLFVANQTGGFTQASVTVAPTTPR